MAPQQKLAARPAARLLGLASTCLAAVSRAATAPRRFLAQPNASLPGEEPTFADPACSANPGCGDLGGNCCPAGGGMILACCYDSTPAPSEPAAPGPTALPMEPSCDHINVGFPNCGEAARCQGEYGVKGSVRTLTATSDNCAYVTFKTQLTLDRVLQMDADAFISPGTCSQYDNLAFWFFQTIEVGDALEEPTTHWDAFSEVDLFESYIGPGGVNSVNSNFAATGLHVQWQNFTIVGGMRQHITMWQDTENGAGCPATRTAAMINGLDIVQYGKELPVVSIYVAHCAPGAPCCKGADCKQLQSDPNTARGCITVKEAPLLLALSNWGAGHHVTQGCEIGVSDVTVTTK